jgi:lipid A ethanolaminephosphotransferase
MDSKKSKFEISYLHFCLAYPFLTYAACNALNLEKLTKWFQSKSGLDYLSLVTFLTIGLCLYVAVFTLLAHRRTIKPLAMVLTFLSGASTYFINRYSIAIDRGMVANVFNTNSTEAIGFLSFQMVPYAVFMIMLPIGAISKLDIQFSNSRKYLLKTATVVLVSLSLAVGLLYWQFNGISRAVNSSNKLLVQTLIPINYLQSLGSLAQNSVSDYYRSQKTIEFTGSIAKPGDLIVVMAIGETSRQKSFSLYGYNRETNPLLSKQKDLYILNGNARVGSTLYALPEILIKKGIPLPLATKKVGVETFCFVNYTMYEACDSIGEVAVSNCAHDGKCYDEDVIPLLTENLKTYNKGYRLVLLHLGGGSHGPSYHLRHPPEFQHFKPMCLDADVVNKCTIEELYNSFDNTILYVDFVVNRIIEELDQSKLPYVFIYLSDHGESLLEEGRIFHGMPLGVPLPPEQAQIPLIVKSSVPIAIDKREVYEQRDIFDTVAALFSIQSESVDQKASFIFLKRNEIK